MVSDVEVFRPRNGYWLFAAAMFFALGFWLTGMDAADPLGSLAGGLAVSSVACISHVVFVRPKIELSKTGIRIVNLLSEAFVGWHDVQSIDTRFAFTVATANRRIMAVAAPAPGRYHARTVHRAELRGLALPAFDQLRPGDSPRSESGVVAQLARRYWHEYQLAAPQAKQPTIERPRIGLPAVGIFLLTASLAISQLHA